nr:efflux RND transporter periplasmic adaptor subunit [Salinivirgaceae bacterium]
ELKFRVGEEIAGIEVTNGQYANCGSTIAQLNTVEYRQKVQQAQTALEKSKLDFQDVLIGMGYELKDSANIPTDKMELARIKSGFSNAQGNYEVAQRNLSYCTLTAPFGGKVANIKQKVFEKASGEAFCTLIDDTEFEVTFQVLETELLDIKLNNGVKVVPFSMESKVFYGLVSEINPVVDKNGLVQVKALVKNPGELMEGMNVKVLIEKEELNQFVVPKSAVVLRDNYEVLFKVLNGIAYWNYVETVLENTTQYTVIPHPEKNSAKLEPGDTIIISGNLNLAHESYIEIIE